MYAVVRIGSSQVKVSEGDIVNLSYIAGVKEGDTVTLSEVLLVSSGDKLTIGSPLVPNVSILAKVLLQKKGKKVRIAKFKAKARYRRVSGFRPLITQVQVESIGKSVLKKSDTPETKKKPIKRISAKSKTA